MLRLEAEAAGNAAVEAGSDGDSARQQLAVMCWALVAGPSFSLETSWVRVQPRAPAAASAVVRLILLLRSAHQVVAAGSAQDGATS